MKFTNKIMLFVFVILGLIFLLSQNIKAETAPRMIFTNKETEMPDLYITKTVKSSNDIPENTEFTFEVKVDGIPYANKEYEIYTEGSSTVKKASTDQNGEVVLKNNQKARFVYVGVGKTYEVAETSKIDGYKQIIPAEGTSYIGTITSKGATAAFTNEFIDPHIQTEYTEFKISKRITSPQGYEMKNDTFSFLLSLDGKKYANKEYEVYDLNSGNFIKNEKTDENGNLLLEGNQYALFSEIETGIEYEVKELEKEGWWSTNGNTNIKGVTQSVLTNIEFNNSQTSFLVTKKMDDNSVPDEFFTFQLTDGNKMVWKDASYFLYSTKGELLKEEKQKTDEQGCFCLKAGETAVFVGISPDTEYNIKELPLRGYSQMIPSSSDGYVEKKVNSTIEELPFVNHEERTKGMLMVTKKIKNEEGETPSESSEFTFSISKITRTIDENNVETEIITPIKGASYEKNEGLQTIYNMTDENGYFKLKAGETVRFTSLSSGEYQVEEISDKMPRNYYTNDSERIQRKNLKLSDESGVYFEFENIFKMHKLDILIHKVSNTDGSILSGAVFRLYTDESLENEYIPEGVDNWNGFRSDENGNLTIKELPLGTYYLKETESPSGYGLAVRIHKIDIIRKRDSYHAVIDGIESSSKEGAFIPLTLGEIKYENGDVVFENDLAEYSFKNREKRNNCSIKVTKYKNSFVKIPLEGVSFRLTDQNGKSIDKTTDEKGIIVFDGLEEGEYELTELNTKSGLSLLGSSVKITLPYCCSVETAEEMKLDTSKAEFVSTEDAWFWYDLSYSISNTAMLHLPKTGGIWMLGLIGIGFIFLGIILYFTKRGVKNE